MPMEIFQPVLPKLLLLNHVFDLAKKMQMPCFLVGGYVRDLCIKRPSKDLDFVLMGDAISFAEALSQQLKGAHFAFFKTFGTAQVKYGNFELEFVGARKESYQFDSRKPEIEAGTFLEDLTRRDFTINAMALEIWPANGNFHDPFDGLKHLAQKKIKTPTNPQITFSDDPLRMMRAIRFATQLDFTIEKTALQAIAQQAQRLKIISQERISEELNKIILSSKPSIGFKLLFETELLHVFFPEMVRLHGVKSIDGKAHKDNFFHTLKVLDNIAAETNNLWLRWAAILHDIAKPATQKYEPELGWTFHGHDDLGARQVPGIFKRLKLPLNEKMKFVQKMVKLHLRPIALTKTAVTDSAVRRLLFEASEDIAELMILCKADITSANDAKVKRYLRNYDILQKKIAEVEEKDRLRNWQPPIDGNEIIEMFSLKPGPEVGILKTHIREAILEGEIPNERTPAINFLIKKAQEMGLLYQKNI